MTTWASETDARSDQADCAGCGRPIPPGEVVVRCPRCGGGHHESCWRKRGGCGAIACSLHEVASLPKLTITSLDLDAAAPLPSQAAKIGGTAAFAASAAQPRAPKTSGKAIASFIVGLAGIPFFGLITGVAAVVLACIALPEIRRARGRGYWFAGLGLFLGLADVVGWIFLIHHFAFGPANSRIDIGDFKADLTAVRKLPEPTRRAMNANVLITVRAGLLGDGIGSGIILGIDRGEALILTNRHVVDHAFAGDGGDRIGKDDVSIRYIDDFSTRATVVWIAPGKVDLALVKAPCRSAEAQAARWKKGREFQVGDAVFAVGNPHGFAWTHTQGAVSGLRWKEDAAARIHVVQTSAAINPGNSGGGLYDREGWLVGVNTWTNDKRVSEGISFAIGFESFLDLVPPNLLPKAEQGK